MRIFSRFVPFTPKWRMFLPAMVVVVGLAMCLSSVWAQSVAGSIQRTVRPQALFPQVKQIDSLRTGAAWGRLQSVCTADLKLESHPIADFSPALTYGPTGPRVEGEDAPGPTLSREGMVVYNLALCYQISGDTKFSSKAEKILDGWAHTTKRIGLAQGTFDFSSKFPFALLGAYVLKQDKGWDSNDFTRFVKELVVPANESDRANNHGNWGMLLLATAGGYLNDQGLIARSRQRWLELMRTQVAEDGSLPHEICRSNTSDYCGGPTKGIKGIVYTHVALYPTTIAAEIFRNLGQDVYSTPEGNLLCKAYGKAAAWSLHPETFPYYASNGGMLMGVSSVNYFYILEQRCHVPDGAAALDKLGATIPDALDLKTVYGR